nr:hypothetical protein CFP56_32404 [Quercus suber]
MKGKRFAGRHMGSVVGRRSVASWARLRQQSSHRTEQDGIGQSERALLEIGRVRPTRKAAEGQPGSGRLVGLHMIPMATMKRRGEIARAREKNVETLKLIGRYKRSRPACLVAHIATRHDFPPSVAPGPGSKDGDEEESRNWAGNDVSPVGREWDRRRPLDDRLERGGTRCNILLGSAAGGIPACPAVSSDKFEGLVGICLLCLG